MMRKAITAWITRHQLAAYFIWAYAITWLLVLPLVGSALGWWSLSVPAAWHALGALGPSLSAFGVEVMIAAAIIAVTWKSGRISPARRLSQRGQRTSPPQRTGAATSP
jgi:hypothetical protein